MTTVITVRATRRYGARRMPPISLSRSFALDVAAPSLRADPDAPWTGAPGAHGEAGLAAAFWVAFHGLSVFIHAVLVIASVAGPVLLALVPIPFLAALCSDVHPVVKPLERVEMAIIELPPPPPKLETPVEVAPALEDALDEVVVTKVSKPKARPKMARLDEDVMSAGILGLLASSPSSDNAVFASLTASDLDGAALGGLMGASVGDSFGVGGLGLRGTGSGGGGTGEGSIGLGSIGTIGRGGTGTGFGRGAGGLGGGARVDLALDGVTGAERARLARMLSACRVTDAVSGTVVVANGGVAQPSTTNACVARVVKRARFVEDGTHPFTVTPR